MRSKKAKVDPALNAALKAVGNLCDQAFASFDRSSTLQAIATHSEIQGRNIPEKSAAFYRSFWPLRSQMIEILGQTYRRFMKLALAHASEIDVDPAISAGIQLRPAINAALYWMRDWYVLACDGENQRIRHLATVPVVSGENASISLSVPPPLVTQSTFWRAPAWLFGVSLVLFGVGLMKQRHMPDKESKEKLGLSHIRCTEVPVVPVDFTSEYPTCCALLNLFDFLTAESLSFKEDTTNICKLLERISLEKCFAPALWKDFDFFALVEPEEDIFPVRTVYDGTTQNIGNNSIDLLQVVRGEDFVFASPRLRYLRIDETNRRTPRRRT
jgi:hypothetical protein